MAHHSSGESSRNGEPLKPDPDFYGPVKRRSCTDIICLFIFFIFLLAWVGIAAYAFRYGSPDKVVRPRDSLGRVCGLDSMVVDEKHLYFFDLTKCATPSVLLNGCSTPQVCVQECPQKYWSADKYLRDEARFDMNDVNENVICVSSSAKRQIKSNDDLRRKIQEGQCSGLNMPSQSFQKRCLPSLKDVKRLESTLTSIHVDHTAVSNSTLVLKSYADIKEFGTNIIQDFDKSWPYQIGAAAVSIVITILIIVLLRWIAKIVVWILLFGLLIVSGVGAYICFERYTYLKNEGPDEVRSKMLLGALESVKQNKTVWLVVGIILTIVAVVFFFVVVFLRKRLVIAVALIEEGSKAVGSVMSTLFFPIFPLLIQCLVILWAIGVGIFLSSIGTPSYRVYDLGPDCHCTGEYQNIKNKSFCEVDKFNQLCNFQSDPACSAARCSYYDQEQSHTIIILQLINAFGAFWGVFFLAGMSQMILACVFGKWYWTMNKSKLPFFTLTESILAVVGNHMGTVAFGSLIIAICAFIRALLEFIQKKLKKYDNVVTKALFCCLKCFFWCLQKFLQFVSSNAYIMCAIYGKNFCASAVHAFNLLMRNALRAAVLDGVVYFLFFIGKLVISGLMVGGTYLVLFYGNNPVLNIHYPSMQLVIVGIVAYIVASVFFNVYSTAVDTLFLCFLEDLERNDKSQEKMFFMSENLMRVLGKKNKRG